MTSSAVADDEDDDLTKAVEGALHHHHCGRLPVVPQGACVLLHTSLYWLVLVRMFLVKARFTVLFLCCY
jgi:hypothetical protein